MIGKYTTPHSNILYDGYSNSVTKLVQLSTVIKEVLKKNILSIAHANRLSRRTISKWVTEKSQRATTKILAIIKMTQLIAAPLKSTALSVTVVLGAELYNTVKLLSRLGSAKTSF